MVRLPETLYLSPDFSTLLDLKVMSGHFCTSKKSADLRWPSRFSLLVLMLAGSIFSSTALLDGASLLRVMVEENLLKVPRTVVTTMCLTANPTVLWFGSASSVSGAAATRAASNSVMSLYLLDCSGDLPEFHD